MSPNATAIVLVPGACATAPLYDLFVSRLVGKGFSPDLIKVVSLLSVGRPEPGTATRPPATMYDDADLVHREVEKLADAGYDILLAAHSYGGLPATESVKGVSKKARQAEGKKGGVARLFYTTAVVPKVGGTLSDVMNGGQNDKPPTDFVVIEGDYMYNEREGSAKNNFSDLPLEEGLKWSERLDTHSIATLLNPITYPGYNDVPVTYLFCEQDKTVFPAMQEQGIANIEQSSGEKVEVLRLDSGHVPYASQPDTLAEIFMKIVGQIEGSSA